MKIWNLTDLKNSSSFVLIETKRNTFFRRTVRTGTCSGFFVERDKVQKIYWGASVSQIGGILQ